MSLYLLYIVEFGVILLGALWALQSALDGLATLSELNTTIEVLEIAKEEKVKDSKN